MWEELEVSNVLWILVEDVVRLAAQQTTAMELVEIWVAGFGSENSRESERRVRFLAVEHRVCTSTPRA